MTSQDLSHQLSTKAVQEGQMLSGLTPKTWRVISYVRDAVVILAIVVGGMYILSHPEKVDAFLNWVLGRHR